jgi:hypothetical protein
MQYAYGILITDHRYITNTVKKRVVLKVCRCFFHHSVQKEITDVPPLPPPRYHAA